MGREHLPSPIGVPPQPQPLSYADESYHQYHFEIDRAVSAAAAAAAIRGGSVGSRHMTPDPDRTLRPAIHYHGSVPAPPPPPPPPLGSLPAPLASPVPGYLSAVPGSPHAHAVAAAAAAAATAAACAREGSLTLSLDGSAALPPPQPQPPTSRRHATAKARVAEAAAEAAAIAARLTEGAPSGATEQARLAALETDVQTLTTTLRALRKQMGPSAAAAGVAAAAAGAGPPVTPTPTTPRGGGGVPRVASLAKRKPPPQREAAAAAAATPSGSRRRTGVASLRSASNGAPPLPAERGGAGEAVMVPHVYGVGEASMVAERLGRAVRAVRQMTVAEVTRLAAYMHPPADLLPYVKILVLLLRLGHKKNQAVWPREELRSDRKELWGSGWRELLPVLKAKKLGDQLGALTPDSVAEGVPYLMQHYLVHDEADEARVGKTSFAALALAEFVHAFYGVWKMQNGVRSQPQPRTQQQPQHAPQTPRGSGSRLGRTRTRTPVKGGGGGAAARSRSTTAPSPSRRTPTPQRAGSARKATRVLSPPVGQPRVAAASAAAAAAAAEAALAISPRVVAGAPLASAAISPPLYQGRVAEVVPPSPGGQVTSHPVFAYAGGPPAAAGAVALPAGLPPAASPAFVPVSRWLAVQGLSQYLPVFAANEIDAEAVGLLTDKV